MANPDAVLQKIISLTQEDPTRIFWHRFVQTTTTKVENEIYAAEPLQNQRDWHTYVFLKQKTIVPNSVFAKVVVAGQYTQNLIDNGSTDLTVELVAQKPPFKIISSKINREDGEIQILWDSFRQAHQLIVNYEYVKKDLELGDLSFVYYTGDTPWAPNPDWPWGVAVSFAPRFAKSILKAKKFMVYENRIPTFVLEPETGSSQDANLQKLFTEIERRIVDPFYAYLQETSPPSPPDNGSLLLG